jgi:hypothetical protein
MKYVQKVMQVEMLSDRLRNKERNRLQNGVVV